MSPEIFKNIGIAGLGLGWIFMLIFWGLIVWTIVALTRSVSRNDHHDRHGGGRGKHGEDEAMSLLRVRYANGEITKEEFSEMKKTLM